MAGTTINSYRFGGQMGYRRDGANRNYVRARNLDMQRGRWISRDPRGLDAGQQNLYAYASGDPANTIDPSGEVIIRPIYNPPWVTGKTTNCGYYSVQWDFVLEAPASQTGYFVQEIQQYGCVKSCTGAPGMLLYQQPYWEAFPVLQGSKKWFCRTAPCGQRGISGYTDRFTPFPRDAYLNTTGNYKKDGTVKFFWMKTTGDLNKDPNWKPKGNPQAGVLLSTNTEPSWWKKPSDQGTTAGHHGYSNWNCCPLTRTYNDIDIEPA